jgi:hypothetical protein
MSTQNAIPTMPEGAQQHAPPLFTTPQLRWMAAAAAAVLLAVCAFMFRAPSYYEYEIVRFLVCFLLTVALAIFFFILWPQELKLTKVPVINVPVTIAGPVVLWLILFLLLLREMPAAGKHWEFFALSERGGAKANVPYFSETAVKADGKNPDFFYLVKDANASTLRGIFVEFSPGETRIDGTLAVPYHKELPVTFLRGAGTVSVSGLTRSDEP